MPCKITRLTGFNVDALRAIQDEFPHDLIVTATTAEFGCNARQALAAVQLIQSRRPGRDTIRHSLHAVCRKLKKLADAEVARSFDTAHVDEVLAKELASLDLDAAVEAAVAVEPKATDNDGLYGGDCHPPERRMIRTEDGVELGEGDRAFNYYDMKPGVIGRMDSLERLDKYHGPQMQGSIQPWFDFIHDDNGKIQSLNGQRICSEAAAKAKGWL